MNITQNRILVIHFNYNLNNFDKLGGTSDIPSRQGEKFVFDALALHPFGAKLRGCCKTKTTKRRSRFAREIKQNY